MCLLQLLKHLDFRRLNRDFKIANQVESNDDSNNYRTVDQKFIFLEDLYHLHFFLASASIFSVIYWVESAK